MSESRSGGNLEAQASVRDGVHRELLVEDDPDAVGCAELIARLRAERERDPKGFPGMHSVGGWHMQDRAGWLREAMNRRLGRLGSVEACWGNILPPGASYGVHTHNTTKPVAVWCLTNSDGVLYIEPDVLIPDRAGQIVIFPGNFRHSVTVVGRERVTVAANLQ
jgi:hypothetical protein